MKQAWEVEPEWRRRNRVHAAQELRRIAVTATRSLGRIARAHHEWCEGRISLDRLLEVIRQETSRV